MSEDPLSQAVHSAAHRDEVREAIHALYADLQRKIDDRRPVCIASGRCCRFEEFGHRLYVTTMELAAFLHELQRLAAPTASGDWDGRGCLFQRNKLCGVHAIRPFGCRMFFCDATSTDWQQEQYERFHERLKLLHEQLAVPYFYIEWREALRRLPLNLHLPAAAGGGV
jgi:Fe-S-cluster containining protein